jgi:hypothetical protein
VKSRTRVTSAHAAGDYPPGIAYSSAEARQEVLDDLARAADALGAALASTGDAYEALDDRNADRLEDELFRPLQHALGLARRTHAGFAERHGLPGRPFDAPPPPAAAASVRPPALIDRAVGSILEADAVLSSLQDSMLPVEVGDEQLRAGLSAVRRGIGDLPARARALARTLGR